MVITQSNRRGRSEAGTCLHVRLHALQKDVSVTALVFCFIAGATGTVSVIRSQQIGLPGKENLMVAQVTYSPKQATPGPSASGPPKWTAIKPSAGQTYLTGAYSSIIGGLMGGDPLYTMGVVSLRRRHEVPNTEFEVYFDGSDGVQAGPKHDSGVPGPRTGSDALSAHAGGLASRSLDSVDMAYVSPNHQLTGGVVQITSAVINANYAQNIELYINGDLHGIPTPHGGTTVGTIFHLGRDFAGTFDTKDWFMGVFAHNGLLTAEQMFILRQEIELARDIPTVGTIPGGIPPLNRVWSVKRQMTVGVGTSPVSWLSDGVVSGDAFTLTGAPLDVVEVATNVGPR